MLPKRRLTELSADKDDRFRREVGDASQVPWFTVRNALRVLPLRKGELIRLIQVDAAVEVNHLEAISGVFSASGMRWQRRLRTELARQGKADHRRIGQIIHVQRVHTTPREGEVPLVESGECPGLDAKP